MPSWLTPLIPVLAALIPLSFAYWRWRVERHLTRRTLVKAILAEVRRLLDVLWMHEKWWRECVEAADTNHPLLPFTTEVYDEHVGDIGALDEDAVGTVVSFYGYVTFINRFQGTETLYIARRQDDGKMIFDVAYLELLRKTLDQFNNEFDEVFARYNIKVHTKKSDPPQSGRKTGQVSIVEKGKES